MSSKSYILVKNTLIFSIANLGSKIIQFLLVPLYTFTLTTAEFGIVEFIMTVANLLTPLISCSISDGLLRFGLDKAEDGKIILTNSFAIVFIGTVISIFLLPILNLISNINQYLFFFLAILNIRIYRDLLSINLKIKDKNKLFAVENIVFTFCIALLSYLFLKIFSLGINGYFSALLISNVISIIFLFVVGNVPDSLNKEYLDKQVIKKLVFYSFPMIINALSWWISNSADRIMMNYYLTSEDLGIYGVAARIPSLLTTFTGIFNQAWVISAITSVGEVDRKKFYLKTYKEFMTIVFVISSLLIMFSRQVIILFTGPEFQAAWLYVPFLVTGVAISSLAGFFGTIYLAKKENNILMWTTIIGAVSNIVVNLFFIPFLGIIGATLSNILTWLLILILRLFLDKDKLLSKNEVFQILSYVFILIIQSYCIQVSYAVGFFASVIVFMIVVISNRKIIISMISSIYLKIGRRNGKIQKDL